jgi:hypothetical protein
LGLKNLKIGTLRKAEKPGTSIYSGHTMGWGLFLAFLDIIIHLLDQIGPGYKEWRLFWFDFDRLAGLRVSASI